MAPADPTLDDDDDAFLYGDSEEDVPNQPGEHHSTGFQHYWSELTDRPSIYAADNRV